MAERTIHQGRNVKRFRDMLGIKQDALADALGDDWSQKKVSLLESKETIEPAILEQVAKVLKVPVEAIESFDEAVAVNFIGSTFQDNASIINHNCTLNINPVEKWMEAMEENKRLYEELLKEKDEKIALLERLMDKK